METNHKKSRWDYTQKHHAEIWKALQKILAAESVETVCGDDALAEKVKAMGIYSTASIVREVRISNGVGGIDQRRAEVFARDFKKKGKA